MPAPHFYFPKTLSINALTTMLIIMIGSISWHSCVSGTTVNALNMLTHRILILIHKVVSITLLIKNMETKDQLDVLIFPKSHSPMWQRWNLHPGSSVHSVETPCVFLDCMCFLIHSCPTQVPPLLIFKLSEISELPR